jgi:hypothetical protein
VRRRIGGSRRSGRHLIGDGLELFLHPASGPSEEEHVADEEPQHHEEGGGGHEADHEPDDEPGFHVRDATGPALEGETAPRTWSYDSSEPARNSLR